MYILIKENGQEVNRVPVMLGEISGTQGAFAIEEIGINKVTISCAASEHDVNMGLRGGLKARHRTKRETLYDGSAAAYELEWLNNGKYHKLRLEVMLVCEPLVFYTWDVLRVTQGHSSVAFRRDSLRVGIQLSKLMLRPDGPYAQWIDYKVLQLEDDRITLWDNKRQGRISVTFGYPEYTLNAAMELLSYTVMLKEWDSDEEVLRVYRIESEDWESMEVGNASGAYAVERSIEKQTPYAYEIIAPYMLKAAYKGDRTAYEWLKSRQEELPPELQINE